MALLVDDLEAAAERWSRVAPCGPIRTFASEGTAEVYVGEEHQAGKVLLIAPIADGPYARARRRRGPGLHHVAIAVPDLDVYLDGIGDSGWLLHVRSSRTLARGTAWLARPGMPFLVEVNASGSTPDERLVDRIHVPFAPPRPALLEALGGVVAATAGPLSFETSGGTVALREGMAP